MIHDLVKKAQKGNKEAFSRLVEEYYDEMFLMAISIVKDSYAADDICQESFVKVYKKIKKINKPESFKSYLGSIVWNNSKDYYKKNKKEVPFDYVEIKKFTDDKTDQKLELLENLMKLKQEYLEILVLRYFQDLKLKEIQKILKIPLSTVKSRIRYALEEMKNQMEGEEYER